MKTRTLFRPVNQHELKLIEATDYQKFPPRLPEQPIFYPVLNEAYATQITKEWNVPTYGEGYVLKFEVSEIYFQQFEVKNVGADMHDEIWVLAEDLDEFNNQIIGKIEVIGKYFQQ